MCLQRQPCVHGSPWGLWREGGLVGFPDQSSRTERELRDNKCLLLKADQLVLSLSQRPQLQSRQ